MLRVLVHPGLDVSGQEGQGHLAGPVVEGEGVACQDLQLVDQVVRQAGRLLGQEVEQVEPEGGGPDHPVHKLEEGQAGDRGRVCRGDEAGLDSLQLGLEDRLHPEEVRGRAARLGDGHQVGGVGDPHHLGLVQALLDLQLAVLTAGKVEGGHGDARQVLGLGLKKNKNNSQQGSIL